MEKLKCREFFKCKEKKCPVYKAEDLKCWLISGTHCRDEIQGKFLEKMEMCLNCKVFKMNMDVAAMKETIRVINRQSAEKNLIKEKTLSDSAIQSLPCVFFMLDKNGRALRWNRNLEVVTGYSGEEISKMNPNDNHGHSEGDLALIEIANTLKKIFRESDLIARIGGDEFAVLVTEAGGSNAETLTTRLLEGLRAYNAKRSRGYNLSISIGISRYDPENPCTIDELLSLADKLMYKQKKNQKLSSREFQI